MPLPCSHPRHDYQILRLCLVGLPCRALHSEPYFSSRIAPQFISLSLLPPCFFACLPSTLLSLSFPYAAHFVELAGSQPPLRHTTFPLYDPFSDFSSSKRWMAGPSLGLGADYCNFPKRSPPIILRGYLVPFPPTSRFPLDAPRCSSIVTGPPPGSPKGSF